MLLFSRQEYTVNRLFNLRRTYSIGAFWVGREMVVVVVMVVGVGWGFGEERRGANNGGWWEKLIRSPYL